MIEYLLDYEVIDLLKTYLPESNPRIICTAGSEYFRPDFIDRQRDLILNKYNPGDVIEDIGYFLVGFTKVIRSNKTRTGLLSAIDELIKDKNSYLKQKEIQLQKEALKKQLHGKRKIRCECCGALLDGERRNDNTVKCSYCGAIQDYYILQEDQ